MGNEISHSEGLRNTFVARGLQIIGLTLLYMGGREQRWGEKQEKKYPKFSPVLGLLYYPGILLTCFGLPIAGLSGATEKEMVDADQGTPAVIIPYITS
jgi:hypothetical protein